MIQDEARIGRSFQLVTSSPKYASPIGTKYTIRAVSESGLMCQKGDGNPSFIPTTCMFGTVLTRDGFILTHPDDGHLVAGYRWLD